MTDGVCQETTTIGFDSAGTTKIGKYVLNHSYMLPGLVMSVATMPVLICTRGQPRNSAVSMAR